MTEEFVYYCLLLLPFGSFVLLNVVLTVKGYREQRAAEYKRILEAPMDTLVEQEEQRRRILGTDSYV